jgi:hypothetical protein
VPPKPKELDRTVLIGRFFGVRHEVDGRLDRRIVEVEVGGATLSRMASSEKIASTAPAAPSRWPMADLVDDMASLPAALPISRSTAPQLDLVAQRRRGAVGVDVVDVGRATPARFIAACMQR